MQGQRLRITTKTKFLVDMSHILVTTHGRVCTLIVEVATPGKIITQGIHLELGYLPEACLPGELALLPFVPLNNARVGPSALPLNALYDHEAVVEPLIAQLSVC